MKNWTIGRKRTTARILRKIGVSSLHELMHSTIVLHISRVNKNGGSSHAITPQDILIEPETLIINMLKAYPLLIRVDIKKSKKWVGAFAHRDVLELFHLEYRLKHGWVATYQAQRARCAMEFREWEGLLDVEILKK